MGKLPITNNEYDKMLLVTNFLQQFKVKIDDLENVEEIVYTPKVGEYNISFKYNNIPSLITLSVNKSKFSSKMKVEYTTGAEKTKTFISEDEKDNQKIINHLFVNILKA